ncbi:MAG: hypothetical protein ACK4JE_01480 [Endomicrobiia bacterium]
MLIYESNNKKRGGITTIIDYAIPESNQSLIETVQKVLEEEKKKVGMDLLNKYKNWVCTEKRMKLAKKEAVYMHPLPADRGAEVEDAVIDGPQSIVFDQNES